MSQITNGMPDVGQQVPAEFVKEGLETYNKQAAEELAENAEKFMTSGYIAPADEPVGEPAETVTASTDGEEEVSIEGKEPEVVNNPAKVYITGGKATNEKTIFEEAKAAAESKNAADFEALKFLPYIDLHAKLNEAKKNLGDINSMKGMMDQIGNISDEHYAAMVGRMNVAEREKYEGDVTSFYENYPSMKVEAIRIQNLLERMLKVFDQDMIASTTFISKSMVESAALRREAMLNAAEPIPNLNLVIKRLDETAAAYADRTNFDVLFHKLRYPNNVLEIYDDFVKNEPAEAMKYINDVFMPVFNDSNMTKFRGSFIKLCLMDKLEGSSQSTVEVVTFFMTYWLAKMYEREYQSGKCARVKTFIMNVYDCDPSSDIYDCDGGKDYMASVGYTIFMIIATITGGQFTKKQLFKKINQIMDDLLKVLEGEKIALFEAHPGRELELDTNLEAITSGEMEYSELPELPYYEKDELDDDDSEIPDGPVEESENTEAEVEDSEETEDTEAEETEDTEISEAVEPEEAPAEEPEDEDGCNCGCPCCDPDAKEDAFNEAEPEVPVAEPEPESATPADEVPAAEEVKPDVEPAAEPEPEAPAEEVSAPAEEPVTVVPLETVQTPTDTVAPKRIIAN